VFILHNINKLGVCRCILLGSPAGRCGLIGLSCFLHSSSAFSRFVSIIPPDNFGVIPSTQPLSAPHASVALSLHSTNPPANSLRNPASFPSRKRVFVKIDNIKYKPPLQWHQYCFISFPCTTVPFRSIATLAFPNPKAKKHASPAVNGRRLLPSFFGHLQPPPLLRSQAARPTATKLHSVPPFRFSAFPPLAQGCFTCLYVFQSHLWENQYLYSKSF